MSYHIIHDKQFIKIKDRYLCMILGGDSNLVDAQTGKTSRSWYPTMFNGTLFPTKKDILAQLKKDEERIDEDNYPTSESYIFGVGLRMGGRQTFSQYKAFFMTAIKKAITIEQFNSMSALGGITIEFQHSYNNTPDTKDGIEGFSVQLEDESILEMYEANKGRFDWISAKFNWGYENLASDIRKRFFKRKKKNEGKELITVDSFYTIMIVDRYFKRNTNDGGYMFSHYSPYHKLTKEKAESKLKQLVRKYPKRGFNIKKIKERAQIYV